MGRGEVFQCNINRSVYTNLRLQINQYCPEFFEASFLVKKLPNSGQKNETILYQSMFFDY